MYKIKNKYSKWYDALISTRKERSYIGIYEKHHIIPKCLGGGDIISNIVNLTPREHFIAHLLLCKATRGKERAKCVYAFHKMSMCCNEYQKRYKIKSFQYSLLKSLYKYVTPYQNTVKWSKGEKKQISIRQTGENNSMYGKKPWNYGLSKENNDIIRNHGIKLHNKYKSGDLVNSQKGKKRSCKTKEKISVALSGKPKSAEHKKKLSIINTGKKLSQATKDKMSKSRRGIKQQILICPHCGKRGGTTMYRWHFDNCKMKG